MYEYREHWSCCIDQLLIIIITIFLHRHLSSFVDWKSQRIRLFQTLYIKDYQSFYYINIHKHSILQASCKIFQPDLRPIPSQRRQHSFGRVCSSALKTRGKWFDRRWSVPRWSLHEALQNSYSHLPGFKSLGNTEQVRIRFLYRILKLIWQQPPVGMEWLQLNSTPCDTAVHRKQRTKPFAMSLDLGYWMMTYPNGSQHLSPVVSYGYPYVWHMNSG